MEILTPGFHGEKCRHNGNHVGFELACDECDFYLVCFPDWKETTPPAASREIREKQKPGPA